MSEFDFEAWWLRQHAHTEPEADDVAPRPIITVRKMAAYLPISDELLHPDRYQALKVTWWQRTQWRWAEYRYRMRLAWDVLRDRHDCGDYL